MAYLVCLVCFVYLVYLVYFVTGNEALGTKHEALLADHRSPVPVSCPLSPSPRLPLSLSHSTLHIQHLDLLFRQGREFLALRDDWNDEEQEGNNEEGKGDGTGEEDGEVPMRHDEGSA